MNKHLEKLYRYVLIIIIKLKITEYKFIKNFSNINIEIINRFQIKIEKINLFIICDRNNSI